MKAGLAELDEEVQWKHLEAAGRQRTCVLGGGAQSKQGQEQKKRHFNHKISKQRVGDADSCMY